MEELKQAKKNLENQLKEAKESLHENNGKFSKEVWYSPLYPVNSGCLFATIERVFWC